MVSPKDNFKGDLRTESTVGVARAALSSALPPCGLSVHCPDIFQPIFLHSFFMFVCLFLSLRFLFFFFLLLFCF